MFGRIDQPSQTGFRQNCYYYNQDKARTKACLLDGVRDPNDASPCRRRNRKTERGKREMRTVLPMQKGGGGDDPDSNLTQQQQRLVWRVCGRTNNGVHHVGGTSQDGTLVFRDFRFERDGPTCAPWCRLLNDDNAGRGRMKEGRVGCRTGSCCAPNTAGRRRRRLIVLLGRHDDGWPGRVSGS